MGALATVLTAILDIAHLVGVAAVEHLLHKTVIIAGVVARLDLFEAVPVIDKDLLEDVPVPARLENHQSAPSEGYRDVDDDVFLPRLALWVHPVHRSAPACLHPPSHPRRTGTSGYLKNANSLTIKITPCGRTIPLDRRTPWSHGNISGIPAWACHPGCHHEIEPSPPSHQ